MSEIDYIERRYKAPAAEFASAFGTQGGWNRICRDVAFLISHAEELEAALAASAKQAAERDSLSREVDSLRSIVTRLTHQVKGYQAEREAIQNDERVVTCAFCGYVYPPGTPTSNHAALAAHVAVCPEHPLGERIRQLEAALAEMNDMKNRWEATAGKWASEMMRRGALLKGHGAQLDALEARLADMTAERDSETQWANTYRENWIEATDAFADAKAKQDQMLKAAVVGATAVERERCAGVFEEMVNLYPDLEQFRREIEADDRPTLAVKQEGCQHNWVFLDPLGEIRCQACRIVMIKSDMGPYIPAPVPCPSCHAPLAERSGVSLYASGTTNRGCCADARSSNTTSSWGSTSSR